jgi:hypothetical protein
MSLTEQIDTTTPGGKLTFHLMGTLAEFERDLIRERTNAGLAAARARRRSTYKRHSGDFCLSSWQIWESTCAHRTAGRGAVRANALPG